MADEIKKSRDWTDAELRACVMAYRDMQLADEAGLEVNKTAKRNEVLSTALQARSVGSYERRMGNITWVVSGLGLPILPRYPPLPNVGTNVAARIVGMINEVWDREHAPEMPTPNPDELQARVQSAQIKIRAGQFNSMPIRDASVDRMEGKSFRFVRDPNVIAWVLWNADGICEACGNPAPFKRSDGQPYLEVHHVRPLADGGPDSADNAIAVCPTCHRRFHHGNDKARYRKATLRKVERLIDHPGKEGQ